MEQMGTKVNLNGKQWEQGRQREQGRHGNKGYKGNKDGVNGNMGGKRERGTQRGNKDRSQWGNGQLMGMGKAELQACLRKLYSFMFDRNT